jgi:hypothetical protein
LIEQLMRGLRHTLKGTMAPDWSALTAICVTSLNSGRAGTRINSRAHFVNVIAVTSTALGYRNASLFS